MLIRGSPPGMHTPQAKGIDAPAPAPAEEAPPPAAFEAQAPPPSGNGPIPVTVQQTRPCGCRGLRGRHKAGCRLSKAKVVPPSATAPVTTSLTSLGFPSWETALEEQKGVAKTSASQCKRTADELYGEVRTAAGELQQLTNKRLKLNRELTDVNIDINRLMARASRCEAEAEKARERESVHMQAWKQLEKDQVPNSGVYDHRIPSDGNAIVELMHRINGVHEEYIKDTKKKFYVGIVNSLERLKQRHGEHGGKFNHLIMLALHEMANETETKTIEDTVIAHVKFAYKDRCVNINRGGNGVTESKVNESRYCLYMCFEA